MTKPLERYLEHCLYFTSNSLSRVITRMAEEEFGKLGLSVSHSFLLMIVANEPGISQKELSFQLNLAQSTVSRFVDTLIYRGFLEKKSKGKQIKIYSTHKGKAQLEDIEKAWNVFYKKYSDILGKEEGETLAKQTYDAYLRFSKSLEKK